MSKPTARARDGASDGLATRPNARALHGDVTRLDGLPLLDGAFDLVLDIGCFHSIAPRSPRRVRARRRGAHAATGATLFVFAFARRPGLVPIGVTAREMRDRFAPWFEPVGRITGTRPPGAAYYLLRRTAAS